MCDDDICKYNDYCDDCKIYGDNYSYDEDGNFINNCSSCPFNLAAEYLNE